MQVVELHPWDVSAVEARAIQDSLRARLELADGFRIEHVRAVAGVDNTYIRSAAGTAAYAVVVALTFPELAVIETVFGSAPVSFPYVPGLLAFREAPAVLDAFRELRREPDVVLFDGHGYAHPRRFGLASHLGVVLGRPSIGCAKSRLVGSYAEPAREFGAWTPLVDRGQRIGAAVRTRPTHAPLFISQGNQVSLETAVAMALSCCRDNRFMPEPTRLAHELVTQYARDRTAPQNP
jgi:deoxyribonuclease V